MNRLVSTTYRAPGLGSEILIQGGRKGGGQVPTSKGEEDDDSTDRETGAMEA